MLDCLERLGCGVRIRVDATVCASPMSPAPAAITRANRSTCRPSSPARRRGSSRRSPRSAAGRSRSTAIRRCAGARWHRCTTRSSPSAPRSSRAQEWGHLPVTVAGPLRGADAVMMPGDVSSQYITALMLIGPYIPGGLHLWLSTPSVSSSYLGITAVGHGVVRCVRRRRVRVAASSSSRASTSPRRSPSSPMRRRPAIRSPLRPWSAERCACVASGGTSVQGDARFVDVLASMGCLVSTRRRHGRHAAA